jgi:hypothetical protein
LQAVQRAKSCEKLRGPFGVSFSPIPNARREGVEIQVYAAVICCLLLNQLTGRKPTKWMVTLMAFYLQGLATDADVLKELNRRDNTGVRLRAKDELWKKLGY